jgi:hypothetical protein
LTEPESGFFRAVNVDDLPWRASTIVEPSRLVVVPLAATLCAATLWLFRHLPDSAPLRRVRISLPLLAVRAAVASVSVILLTSVAHILGPKWSGLVTGYPVNALPDERLRHLRV